METFIYQQRLIKNPWAISYTVTNTDRYFCEIEAVIYSQSLNGNGKKYAYYEGIKNYLDVTNWVEDTLQGLGLPFNHEDYEQVKLHFLAKRGFTNKVMRKEER